MRDFAKTRIYRDARRAAIESHAAFKDVEPHEDMTPGLLLELSQAAYQVCAKIGAAHAHRLDLDLCLENLGDAKSKAAECLVFLDLAHSMGYLTKVAKKPLSRQYERLLDRLGNLMDRRRPDDHFEGRGFLNQDDDDD